MGPVSRPLVTRRVSRPPIGPELTARPRLTELIDVAVRDADVVIAAAVAGAGKTTAVAQALAGRTAVGWLRVEHTDADPVQLLAYLEAAVAAAEARDGQDGETTVAPGARWASTIPGAQEKQARAGEPATGPARALAGFPPTEAAGLLAARAAAREVVLVVDGIERIDESAAAWEVLRSLVEYGAPGLTLVLLGRRPPPAALFRIPLSARVATVPAAAFDLTRDELYQLLDDQRGSKADVPAVLGQTGGWVAAALHGTATGPCPALDRLVGHVLADLPAELVGFLVRTSPFPEVTVDASRLLGLPDGRARFHQLSVVPVPGVLEEVPGVPAEQGAVLRCHPVFRERLLAAFDRLPDRESRPILARIARHHLAEGRTEEAVTELLRAGAVDEALPIAEQLILPIVERGELALADAWLDALQDRVDDSDTLVTARFMLAIAQDDFTRAGAVLTRLEAGGDRDGLATRSDRAAAMMAWCYLHQGRPDALAELVRIAPHAALVDAVRYASWMITNPGPHSPPSSPPLTGDPSDALILITDYTFGRSRRLDSAPTSEWVRIVASSGRIATLRASGRLVEALREHDVSLAAGDANLALRVYVGPELLIDAELHDRARAAVAEGRALAESTGSVGYRALNAVAAAKLELRLADDPAAARRVIDATAHLIKEREFRQISGVLDTWYGLALLRQNVNLAAAKRLRRAVREMRAGHRLLDLPVAAVYLAEAEWRLGNESEADAAADLALAAAESLGSNHELLCALHDVPEVVSRRIDALPNTDSPWHVLGRALLSPGRPISSTAPIASVEIHLRDFGNPTLHVNGHEVRPRITKSYELMALLSAAPRGLLNRSAARAALFPERPEQTAATYLRQATHCLRRALPDPRALQVRAGRIGFGPDVVVRSDAAVFETLLTEASRLAGAERLDALAEALELAEAGPYLARTDSPWVQQRRQRLLDRVTTARFDAADLAFRLGHLRLADNYCAAVLADDPYQEAAWRLQMRVASALGSHSGVLTAYRRCCESLAELGVRPAESTRALLDRLRR